MKDLLISSVLSKMNGLSDEQRRALGNALVSSLDNYDLQEKRPNCPISEYVWKDDLERFLYRKEISGKSDKTIERYRYILTKLLSRINKPIQDITSEDLNDYIESYKRFRNVANSTLEGIRLCMSSFFSWNHERGYIPNNPAVGVDPIKVPKKLKKAYTDEDLEMIKRSTTTLRDLAIVEFLYATGVRVSELCSLDRRDVRITSKQITVYGKGDKEREVYLTPVSCMYLNMYLTKRTDDNPALFVGLRKPYKRLEAGGVRAMLRKIGNHIGVDKVHPHRFRTTMATNLIKKGMPVEELKTILGHEKMDTTMIYAMVDKGKVQSDISRLLSA